MAFSSLMTRQRLFRPTRACGWWMVASALAVCRTSAARPLAPPIHIEGRPTAVAPLEEAPGGPHQVIQCSFDMELSPSAHGLALVLWPADAGRAQLESYTAWDEPNLSGALAVAFDCSDPPPPRSKDKPRLHWFSAPGNIYDRPQHQISVHYDGRERLNIVSPVDFRSQGEPRHIELVLNFVCGACELSLAVNGQPVLDRQAVLAVPAYAGQLFLGFRDREGTALDVSDVRVTRSRPIDIPPPPERVTTFQRELVATADAIEKPFTLPNRGGRILAAFSLQEPPGGWDPWDRIATIEVKNGDQWLELLRVITPYQREWTWLQDVTDFSSLLRGWTELRLRIPTWVGSRKQQRGFAASLDLLYFPCSPFQRVVKLVPLWRGRVPVGDPDHPVTESLPVRTVAIPSGCRAAKLRLLVTGHNGHNNIAEFKPLTFWVDVNGDRFEHRLWREDAWLNPCRPQSGTWKFDRAGWRPGDIVAPIEFRLDDLIRSGAQLTLRWGLEPWVDERRGEKGGAGHHLVSACLVFYE